MNSCTNRFTIGHTVNLFTLSLERAAHIHAHTLAQECRNRALAGRTKGLFGYFKNQRKVFADLSAKRAKMSSFEYL